MTQTNNEREALHKIMEKVQVYASSYSLVGTRFASDNQLEEADSEKLALYNMIKSALSQSPISQNEQREAVAYTMENELYGASYNTGLFWPKDCNHIPERASIALYTTPQQPQEQDELVKKAVADALEEAAKLCRKKAEDYASLAISSNEVKDFSSDSICTHKKSVALVLEDKIRALIKRNAKVVNDGM